MEAESSVEVGTTRSKCGTRRVGSQCTRSRDTLAWCAAWPSAPPEKGLSVEATTTRSNCGTYQAAITDGSRCRQSPNTGVATRRRRSNRVERRGCSESSQHRRSLRRLHLEGRMFGVRWAESRVHG